MPPRPALTPTAVLGTLVLATALALSDTPAPSPIAADERVVLIETVATFDPAAQTWTVPLRGWIHEPAESVVRVAAIEELLEVAIGREIAPEERSRFEERVGWFLVDNERGKRIDLEMAGRRVVLPPSAPNGHFEGSVTLSEEEAEVRAEDGRLALLVRAPDGRGFRGSVRLVAPEGISVISDLDDTLKVTKVRDRRRMLARTFLERSVAVPGMPEFLRDWHERGVVIHVVSSSPEHLRVPLRAFFEEVNLPVDELLLKPVRLKDETILDLFAPGTATKPAAISAIIERFPARRFVLVGDTGEEDPEVFAELIARYPGRILGIALRNVTGARRGDARLAPLFAGVPPERWAIFEDPATLEEWFSGLVGR